MYHAAGASQGFVVLLLVGLQDVDGERGGQRGQRRAGSRVGRGNQADDKDHAEQHWHTLAEGYRTEQLVGLLGHGNAVSLHVHGKQRTQNQEQGDDDDLQEDTHDEVLGRLIGIFAGQAALHQVLVEACRGDDHEDAGDELFPEVSALLGIVKEEDPRRVVARHGLAQAAQVVSQTLGDKVDAQHHRQDEAETLQRVGPDNGLHTTLQRI